MVYVVTLVGIEANPDNVNGILETTIPRIVKENQSLTGKMAALGHFLSKSGEKSILFYEVLKKVLNTKEVEWTIEAKEALRNLKESMISLPTLASSRPRETLTMYLATIEKTLSTVM